MCYGMVTFPALQRFHITFAKINNITLICDLNSLDFSKAFNVALISLFH